MKPFVFESKKATLLVIALAFITFLQTTLPAVFPTVSSDIFASLTDLLTKLSMAYLGSQGIVDAVKAFRNS
jgi:hypothetical protein